MTSISMRFILWNLILKLSDGNFDFFADSYQTKLLHGAETGGIYYVQNGVINQYAMTLQNKEIPSSVKELVFHWSLIKENTNASYSVNIIHTPGPVMNPPILNVTSTGYLTFDDEVISIKLPCTGRARDHADFLIQIKFVPIPNPEDPDRSEPLLLNFKRRKLCEKNETMSAVNASDSDEGRDIPFRKISSSASTAIALGSASATVLLLFALLGFLYATRKHRRPNIPCSSLAHLDYVSQHHRRTDITRRPVAGMHNGSYATLASFSNVSISHPIPRRMPLQNSVLNARQKSFSLNYRNSYEHRQLLLQNSSSLSSASTTEHGNNFPGSIYDPNHIIGSSNNLSNAPRSLVIEQGVLRLSSSNIPPPPSHPLPPLPGRIQRLTSSSSSSATSSSYSSSSSSSRHRRLLRNKEHKSLVSSSLTTSSNPDDSFTLGETLGIRTSREDDVNEENSIPQTRNRPDKGDFMPHLYPHLMPQNIQQANERLSRINSQSSVLV